MSHWHNTFFIDSWRLLHNEEYWVMKELPVHSKVSVKYLDLLLPFLSNIAITIVCSVAHSTFKTTIYIEIYTYSSFSLNIFFLLRMINVVAVFETSKVNVHPVGVNQMCGIMKWYFSEEVESRNDLCQFCHDWRNHSHFENCPHRQLPSLCPTEKHWRREIQNCEEKHEGRSGHWNSSEHWTLNALK